MRSFFKSFLMDFQKGKLAVFVAEGLAKLDFDLSGVVVEVLEADDFSKLREGNSLVEENDIESSC